MNESERFYKVFFKAAMTLSFSWSLFAKMLHLFLIMIDVLFMQSYVLFCVDEISGQRQK